MVRVCSLSLSLSDRQKECVRACFMQKEREKQEGREKERETEREGERCREDVQNSLFLKGMTGALAPFSYLVFN